MNRTDASTLAALLDGQRWAALATVADDAPHASMVAYVATGDASAVVLHLSRLARHSVNLLTRPRASLVVSEADQGEGDPQMLARLTVSGPVEAVGRDDPQYDALRARYLARLPSAAPLFAFGDFGLFLLRVEAAHYVGGFARAYALSAAELGREVTRGRAARTPAP